MLPGDFLPPITFRAALRYIRDSSRRFAVMESITKLSAHLNKFLTVSNILHPLCDLSKSKYPCVNSIQECPEGGVLQQSDASLYKYYINPADWCNTCKAPLCSLADLFPDSHGSGGMEDMNLVDLGNSRFLFTTKNHCHWQHDSLSPLFSMDLLFDVLHHLCSVRHSTFSDSVTFFPYAYNLIFISLCQVAWCEFWRSIPWHASVFPA